MRQAHEALAEACLQEFQSKFLLCTDTQLHICVPIHNVKVQFIGLLEMGTLYSNIPQYLLAYYQYEF